MTRTASTIEGFRKPWTGGAYAYHEADTFAAALEGFRRVRTTKMFHMSNTGEAGQQKCVHCGLKLADPYPVNVGTSLMTERSDEHSTWTYNPTLKKVGNGMHYGCSWSNLFNRIFKAHDEGKIW